MEYKHYCTITKETITMPFINMFCTKSVHDYLRQIILPDLADIIAAYTSSHLWKYVESHHCNIYSTPMICYGNLIMDNKIVCFYPYMDNTTYTLSINSCSTQPVIDIEQCNLPTSTYYFDNPYIYILFDKGICVLRNCRYKISVMYARTYTEDVTCTFIENVKYIKKSVFYTNHEEYTMKKWKKRNILLCNHPDYINCSIKNINLYVDGLTVSTKFIAQSECEIISMLIDDDDEIIVAIYNENTDKQEFTKLAGTKITYANNPNINLLYCDTKHIMYTRLDTHTNKYYLARF